MISSVLYFEKDRRVIFHDNNVSEIRKDFSPGFYQFYPTQDSIGCSIVEMNELHTPYKSEANDRVIKGVMAFFSSRKLKKQINMMGFPHKMGVLLYGPPGTGKTTLLNYVSQLLLEQQNAIIMVCSNFDSVEASISMAKAIREIQTNPIVIIMDEFERFVSNSNQEAVLKTFLDGGDSIDNCLILGATNYIEQVPKSIGERESRLRIVEEIKGIENREEIESIVNSMLDNADVPASFKRDKLIDSIGLNVTLDFIKNKVIDSLMGKKIKTDSSARNQIGFNRAVPAAEEEDFDGTEIFEFLFPGTSITKKNTYRQSGVDTNLD